MEIIVIVYTAKTFLPVPAIAVGVGGDGSLLMGTYAVGGSDVEDRRLIVTGRLNTAPCHSIWKVCGLEEVDDEN